MIIFSSIQVLIHKAYVPWFWKLDFRERSAKNGELGISGSKPKYVVTTFRRCVCATTQVSTT